MTADKSDFIATIKQEYLHQGVILTTKRSKRSRVELKCDLGGSYTPSTEAQDWYDVLSRSFVPVPKVNGQSEKSLETTTILLVAICEVILRIARRLTEPEREQIRNMGQTGIPVKWKDESKNTSCFGGHSHSILHNFLGIFQRAQYRCFPTSSAWGGKMVGESYKKFTAFKITSVCEWIIWANQV